VVRKGGRRDALAINPQTAARLRAYLELAGHGADLDGPLFRPLRPNGKRQDARRAIDPDAIDRVVRKFATALGLDRGCSAHSMRATFITKRRQARRPAEGCRASRPRHHQALRPARL
jgi:integrase/recombinase XerD